MNVSTLDNDTAGFTVTETDGSTSVNESGVNDTLTIVLTAQPVSDVVLSIASSDNTESSATSTVTFTTNNWNTAQSVQVTAVDDFIIDGNQNSTLAISIDDANSDNNFDALADQTVTVQTIDNDVAAPKGRVFILRDTDVKVVMDLDEFRAPTATAPSGSTTSSSTGSSY